MKHYVVVLGRLRHELNSPVYKDFLDPKCTTTSKWSWPSARPSSTSAVRQRARAVHG